MANDYFIAPQVESIYATLLRTADAVLLFSQVLHVGKRVESMVESVDAEENCSHVELHSFSCVYFLIFSFMNFNEFI